MTLSDIKELYIFLGMKTLQFLCFRNTVITNFSNLKKDNTSLG